MTKSSLLKSDQDRPAPARKGVLVKLLAPLDELPKKSSFLVSQPLGEKTGIFLPRYVFTGPAGGGDTLRVGVFAGFYGDQPEGTYALVRFLSFLVTQPELATGYELYVYPVCNPTGFEKGTHRNRNGRDLNSEFWKQSREPEVLLLQKEILSQFFHGIISLQFDTHVLKSRPDRWR